MIKKSTLCLLLLIISWTVSYAQDGATKKDSLSPIRYTRAELEEIAATALRLKACTEYSEAMDRQLETRNAKIYNQQLIIASRDTTIAAKDSIINTHGDIISLKDEELVIVKDDNKKLNNKLKVTKMAWAGSVAGLVVLWVLNALP